MADEKVEEAIALLRSGIEHCDEMGFPTFVTLPETAKTMLEAYDTALDDLDEAQAQQETIAAEFEGTCTIALRDIALSWGFEPLPEGWQAEDIVTFFADRLADPQSGPSQGG